MFCAKQLPAVAILCAREISKRLRYRSLIVLGVVSASLIGGALLGRVLTGGIRRAAAVGRSLDAGGAVPEQHSVVREVDGHHRLTAHLHAVAAVTTGGLRPLRHLRGVGAGDVELVEVGAVEQQVRAVRRRTQVSALDQCPLGAECV